LDSARKTLDLVCVDCGTFLGTRSETESSHRLWKSRVALRKSAGEPTETYDSSIFIGAQMLQLVESNISRRVVLHMGEGPGVLCWIFNPDVYYSSSKRGATVHRAMKIFYKEVEDPLKLLDEHSTTLEELALPKTEFMSLKRTLEEIREILPASARTFQEWQVGLIDRHEASPSGLGAMDNNVLNRKAENIELFKLPAGWASLYE
jgi:ubiquitin-protein ligase E3 D